ncbi:MAG TPA: hypothetical protein PKC93_16475, partial [Candidatus Obscuribacter sp.]|nr:hypothetical protein [Candidatus Obscuribacter sp.]
RLGFTKALVPRVNLPLSGVPKGLEVIGVESISEALNYAIPSIDKQTLKDKASQEQVLTRELELNKLG